jgi:hypothetical protein
LAEDAKTRVQILGPRLFVGMRVRGLGMLVRLFAVFLGGLRVVLRVFVFAHRVVMLSLMMVMRGGMVMAGRDMVMLGGRMFRHLNVLPLS